MSFQQKILNWPLVPILIVILCLLPFINKAFHIDDPVYLWTAEQIQKDPLDFYGFSVNWYGFESKVSDFNKNPPLVSYYIAMVASIFGFNEIPMHLAFILPAIGVAAGTFYLAKQFDANPLLSSVIAIFSPAFLVSCTNVMCDILMLAFWLWAVYFWIQGTKLNKQLYFFVAVVFICLSIMSKYFGIALIPLLLIYTITEKRSINTKILYLLIPIALLVLYQWLTYSMYGRGLLTDAAGYATERSWSPDNIPSSKILTALAYMGGSALVILLYSPLLWSKRIMGIGVLAVTCLTIYLFFSLSAEGNPILKANEMQWIFIISYSLLATGGVSVLCITFIEVFKNKDGRTLLIFLWILGTFVFSGFVNWTTNSRSILPMIPAISILAASRISKIKTKHFAAILYISPLILASIITLSVCWSDYVLANTARLAAKTISHEYANSPGEVYFEGHWGFQYYMQMYGYKPLNYTKPEVSSGDIIIIPGNNSNTKPIDSSLVTLKKTLQFQSCRWLTTMHPVIGAGFYASCWGPIPYGFGKVPPELYFIYEVN